MLTLVAAVARNGIIGRENDLPWDLPEDRKHFRQLTSGKTILMGRKTFESIMKRNGKLLPNRTNVVVTHDKAYQVPPGVLLYYSLQDALEALQGEQDVCVIGGGQIYQQTMLLAQKLEITHVDMDAPGDVSFPEIDPKVWEKTGEEPHQGYTFATYVRKK
jgi:dihydrofolate reductase